MKQLLLFIFVGFVLVLLAFSDQSFVGENFSDVERVAHRACEIKRGEEKPPLPFLYDGCTLWPNGDWVECCAYHDATYWCGGSELDRIQADVDLKECVNKKKPYMGTVMYYGVRVAGSPHIPWGVRWGFGWEYGKGYR